MAVKLKPLDLATLLGCVAVLSGAVGYLSYATALDDWGDRDLYWGVGGFFYGVAYLAGVGVVACFRQHRLGARAGHSEWFKWLIVAHLALVMLWIPTKPYRVRSEMRWVLRSFTEHEENYQVFYDHPREGVRFLTEAYQDRSRPLRERRRALQTVWGLPDWRNVVKAAASDPDPMLRKDAQGMLERDR